MLCILYVNVAGMCLGLAGLLIDRVLPASAPRRWVWCFLIPTSIVLPGFYRTAHPWALPLSEGTAASTTSAGFHSASMTIFNPQLWARIESLCVAIDPLWVLLSSFLLCWAAANAVHVARVISASRKASASEGRSLVVDDIPVVVTESIGPATVGFLRSEVLVPRWVLALPGAQRQYVLRHEEEHRRSHDARLLFVASLTIILLPWNLALWWQLRRLYLAVEMDCDNRVVKKLGDANAYGELLLKVAQASGPGTRLQPALLGGIGSLERRLTALLDPAPLRRVQRVLFPALALGLLILVVLMPHPVLPGGIHSHVSASNVATAARSSER